MAESSSEVEPCFGFLPKESDCPPFPSVSPLFPGTFEEANRTVGLRQVASCSITLGISSQDAVCKPAYRRVKVRYPPTSEHGTFGGWFGPFRLLKGPGPSQVPR